MLWVLALHVIFMVTWFAGLFYLPRLFVYHTEAIDEISLRRFEIMEWRLFVIMSIGATGTIIFGLWLLFVWWLPMPGWLHLKLVFVVLLVIYHVICGKLVRNFRTGRNHSSALFYRWFNEIPALLLIIIVILAVVKPL